MSLPRSGMSDNSSGVAATVARVAIDRIALFNSCVEC